MVLKQAHQDPGDGRQYHVRYKAAHEERYYWTHVTDSLEHAEHVRKVWNEDHGRDAKIFVRDVSPWREL